MITAENALALKMEHLLLELYQQDLEQFTLFQMNLGRELSEGCASRTSACFAGGSAWKRVMSCQNIPGWLLLMASINKIDHQNLLIKLSWSR